MSDEQIKHMVDRFLTWSLPSNFNPDCGISFRAEFNEHLPDPMRHKPCGTNLFDAGQAEAMVRHMVEGLPDAYSQFWTLERIEEALTEARKQGAAEEREGLASAVERAKDGALFSPVMLDQFAEWLRTHRGGRVMIGIKRFALWVVCRLAAWIDRHVLRNRTITAETPLTRLSQACWEKAGMPYPGWGWYEDWDEG